jgi:hypothetical protein
MSDLKEDLLKNAFLNGQRENFLVQVYIRIFFIDFLLNPPEDSRLKCL